MRIIDLEEREIKTQAAFDRQANGYVSANAKYGDPDALVSAYHWSKMAAHEVSKLRDLPDDEFLERASEWIRYWHRKGG